MPRLVAHRHLHQHVAGEELALRVDLLPAADLRDLLRGHEDLVERVAEALLRRLLADLLRDLLLEARVDVDDVPALFGHASGLPQPMPRKLRMANAMIWSVTRKNTAASADIASTSPVEIGRAHV